MRILLLLASLLTILCGAVLGYGLFAPQHSRLWLFMPAALVVGGAWMLSAAIRGDRPRVAGILSDFLAGL